jgi:hypothetical protein
MEVIVTEGGIGGAECLPDVAIAVPIFAFGAIRTTSASEAAFAAAIAALGVIGTRDATIAAILGVV